MHSAELSEAVDEPGVLALVIRWEAAGPYRHVLGRVDVRLHLLPMTMHSIDEPGAYEPYLRVDGPDVQLLGRDTAAGSRATARETCNGDWVGNQKR
ncbi:MAG: hypothetical protein CSB46_06395 [Micrococcales bacterium]|nr:MAG: hypothetical protein CSB46_06395 [Micrococcales bacterium]